MREQEVDHAPCSFVGWRYSQCSSLAPSAIGLDVAAAGRRAPSLLARPRCVRGRPASRRRCRRDRPASPSARRPPGRCRSSGVVPSSGRTVTIQLDGLRRLADPPRRDRRSRRAPRSPRAMPSGSPGRAARPSGRRRTSTSGSGSRPQRTATSTRRTLLPPRAVVAAAAASPAPRSRAGAGAGRAPVAAPVAASAPAPSPTAGAASPAPATAAVDAGAASAPGCRRRSRRPASVPSRQPRRRRLLAAAEPCRAGGGARDAVGGRRRRARRRDVRRAPRRRRDRLHGADAGGSPRAPVDVAPAAAPRRRADSATLPRRVELARDGSRPADVRTRARSPGCERRADARRRPRGSMQRVPGRRRRRRGTASRWRPRRPRAERRRGSRREARARPWTADGERAVARRLAPAARRRSLVLLALAGSSGARGGCWRASVESMAMERYYVTTPIYYVNSTPHIGHAYTTIAADILARNRRQRGDETFFLTGVDEHAAKVARVAAEQGLSPQEYADQIAVVWRELPERLNASNDFFIRTSDEEHKRFVQGFLQKLYDNGHVYQDVYAGLYCVGCEAFKTEADLVDGKCPEHDREPEWIEERNWFFRLSSFQAAAARALRARRLRPAGVPGQRGAQLHRGRAAGLLDQPRRTDVGDPDPVGSGFGRLRLGRRPRQLPERAHLRAARARICVETFWPAVRHLLAKDILRFHCVYWPAMLLGGRVRAAAAALRPRVPAARRPEDLEVARERRRPARPDRCLRRRPGAVLVCAGDLVRPGRRRLDRRHPRALRARARQRSRQPALADDGDGRALPRRHAARRCRRRTAPSPPRSRRSPPTSPARLDAFDVTGALERIWEVVRALNREVETTAPWQLAKDEARADELDRVLYDLVDGLRAVAVALVGLHPGHGGGDPRRARGSPPRVDWSLVAYGLTGETDGIEAAPPLFPRLELPAA